MLSLKQIFVKTLERYQCMFAEERIEFDWHYFVGFLFFGILYIKETTAYDYCTPYFPQLISIFICHSCFLAGKMKFCKSIPQKPKNEYNFCWRLNYYFSKESNPYNILQRHKKKKNMWTYTNSRLWSLISWKYFVYIDKFLLKFSSL